MIYNKEYFIKKFEAIPEDKLGSGCLNNKCALWHCGVREDINTDGGWKPTEEANALIKLFGGSIEENKWGWEKVYHVNDGIDSSEGDTPKERILNKLRSLN
jgi:hypothetical protein